MGDERILIFPSPSPSPSAHNSVRNANEIRQIAKLYSEGNVFLFYSSLSLSFSVRVWRATLYKFLTSASRGGRHSRAPHRDEHFHLATDLFLFFVASTQPRGWGFLSSKGIHRWAPTLIYSNFPLLFKVSSAVCITLV